MDAISFCGPCLKWKFILAYKDQYGLNGFTFPFLNKYLRTNIRLTSTLYDNLGRAQPTRVFEAECRIDRFTGDITPELPPFLFNFYEAYIRGQITGPDWFVSDDYIRHSSGAPGPNGNVQLYEQWLSEPYTLGQLDADADALIAAVNPDDIPWFKLKTLARFVDTPDRRVLGEMSAVGPEPQIYIPSAQVYDVFARANGELWDVPELKAAAWYIYVPSFWGPLGQLGINAAAPNPPPRDGANYAEPGWFIKLVGFFNMAGNYCEKTRYLDYHQSPVGPASCVSGEGNCGSYFKITPPPIVVGQNAVKILTPNSTCQ